MKQAIAILLTVCLLSASLTSCGNVTRKQIRPLFSASALAGSRI